MKKLYLDIDGVLLTCKNKSAAQGSEVFIDYILKHFDCYWLTTHCKVGDTSSAISYLSEYFPPNVMKKLKLIKPTYWNTLKTEGIDFTSDFIWLDDYVFQAEKDVLLKHGCLNSLILVNLNTEKDLFHIIEKLREKIPSQTTSTS